MDDWNGTVFEFSGLFGGLQRLAHELTLRRLLNGLCVKLYG
jgi:hypothetical protein